MYEVSFVTICIVYTLRVNFFIIRFALIALAARIWVFSMIIYFEISVDGLAVIAVHSAN